MRNFKFTLFTALVVLFVSCSKDDNPAADTSLLMGEWNFEEFTYSGTSTTSIGGQSLTSTYTGEALDLNARLNLMNGGNYSIDGGYTIKLTTTAYGQTMVHNHPFGNLDLTGKYRVEGNKLITTPNAPQAGGMMMLNPGDSEGTIVELTANRLVVTGRQDITTTQQGAEVRIVNEIYQVYTR